MIPQVADEGVFQVDGDELDLIGAAGFQNLLRLAVEVGDDRGYLVFGAQALQQAGDFRQRGHLSAKTQRERAGLCLALTLAPEPELLILDDPALGLDPVARRSLLELMVYATRSEKRTILFSSHLLTDVERVADRIAVLESGHLQACCSMETFRDRVRRVVLRFRREVPALPRRPAPKAQPIVVTRRNDAEQIDSLPE